MAKASNTQPTLSKAFALLRQAAQRINGGNDGAFARHQAEMERAEAHHKLVEEQLKRALTTPKR